MTRKAYELTDEEIKREAYSVESTDPRDIYRAIATAATRKALTEHGVKPMQIGGGWTALENAYGKGWNACLEAMKSALDQGDCSHLGLSVAFSVAYLDGIMEHEPREIQQQWLVVRQFLRSTISAGELDRLRGVAEVFERRAAELTAEMRRRGEEIARLRAENATLQAEMDSRPDHPELQAALSENARLRAERERKVLVPREPSEKMIDEGASSQASFQDNSVWPYSWSTHDVADMRRIAGKVWRYMLAAAEEERKHD